MKKQWISLVAVLALLLTMMSVCAVSASAAFSATVTVGSATAAKGDVVEIPVTISENSYLVNADMFITFDTTQLELVDSYYADPEGDAGDTLCYQANADFFTQGWMYGGNEKEPGQFCFLAATGNKTGITTGGEIFRLAFRLLTDDVDSVKVTFTADPMKAGNGSGDEALELTVVNGTIAVKKVLLGDVDGNGKVNLTDAFAVYRAASTGNVPENVLAYADTNGDGKINLTDAFRVYAIASGK